MATDIKRTVDRYKYLKNDKYNWNIHFQVLAEYFLTRKADFTFNFQPGMFLNRDLYDSTGPKNADILAGALLGMLWPESSQNFRLRPDRRFMKSQENKDYFDEVSCRLHDDMMAPEAGLSLAANEYMREGVNFGTAGIGVFRPEGNRDNIQYIFQCWDVKRMVIDEGPNGFVNRVYYEREETIEQTVLQYGIKKVSEKVRKAYEDGKSMDNKINILHAIEPRYDRDPDGLSVFDMPVASLHIELDGDYLLLESGYMEMPVFVNRFTKNMREKYGRSPAMNALPDVLELNALREAEIVATEKMLDPPLGVIDDGHGGASVIDTSAGAVTVFNMTGSARSTPPVFPINTVGDMKPAKERIEELKQSISDHFYVDRLLDMQNETEMTLGEVLERQKLRAYFMSGMFSRQIAEVWSPLIKRCFNMGLMSGRLGVMPMSDKHLNAVADGEEILVIPAEIAKAMASGEDVYEIEYMTPAVRMMQAELAVGILDTWKFANDIAQTQPEIYDNLDEDASIQLFGRYKGAPLEIFRAEEMVRKIRDARTKKQEQDAQFQKGIEVAKVAAKAGHLAPQQGAPGVQAPGMAQPLAV